MSISIKKRINIQISIYGIFFIMLITGSIFFIPDFLVARYILPPILWSGLIVMVWSLWIVSAQKFITLMPNVFLTLFLLFVFFKMLFFIETISIYIILLIIVVCLFLLLINSDYIQDPDRRREAYFILSLAGLFQVMVGMYQLLTKQDIVGSFNNSAGFSICLAATLPFSLFFIKQKWKGSAIFGMFVSVLCYVFVWLSESRTGIMSMTIIIFLYLYKSGILKTRYRFVAIIFVSILFLFLFWQKSDSAYGRTYIWECSLQMVKNAPVVGLGIDKFKSQYMLFQADYFLNHSNKQFEMLADNVHHPFNEYLKILIEFGWLPFCGVILILIWLLRKFFRSNNIYCEQAILCIFSIAICALFSYPFNYPFVWIVLIFSFSTIYVCHRSPSVMSRMKFLVLKTCSLLCCMVMIVSMFFFTKIIIAWSRIENPKRSKVEKVELYRKSYQNLKFDGVFLYNYAVSLNAINEWESSIGILQECMAHLNDADVQLLLADNYLKTDNYLEAEKSLMLASKMCPNRFIPLYSLMSLYIKMNDVGQAENMATLIINKPIKINSPKVGRIINEAKQYLSRQNNVGE